MVNYLFSHYTIQWKITFRFIPSSSSIIGMYWECLIIAWFSWTNYHHYIIFVSNYYQLRLRGKKKVLNYPDFIRWNGTNNFNLFIQKKIYNHVLSHTHRHYHRRQKNPLSMTSTNFPLFRVNTHFFMKTSLYYINTHTQRQIVFVIK